jgi:hypothetical protein
VYSSCIYWALIEYLDTIFESEYLGLLEVSIIECEIFGYYFESEYLRLLGLSIIECEM